jgi:hypothetical protein
MTTKDTKQTKTRAAAKPTTKRMEAKFQEPSNKPEADALARMALRPSVNAAAVIVEYTKPLGEQDIGALIDQLSAGMDDVWAGDMKRAEAMLYGQAHALQAIFMNFSRRALNQEYQKNLEAFLRMALKAQNQCRMTLETLALIKNPPVVFAKQANINNGGQQQVINGASPNLTSTHTGAGAHAAKNISDSNELLEHHHGQRLDTRAQGATSGADPQLETVGEVHGADISARKGGFIPER